MVTIAELRRFSAAAFGHRYRLELLCGAGDGGRRPGRLPVAAGGSLRGDGQRVLPAGAEDERVGHGRDLEPERVERRVLYARTGAPVWTGLRMMVEDLAVDVDLASAALNWPAAS